jgi:N utilization substance protein B
VGVRREGREHVLQALYAVEMSPNDPRMAVRLFWEGQRSTAAARLFADELLAGILANQARIDEVIAGKSANWALARMARIDLSILRMAAYELLFRDDIPRNVTINEAIEVAKKFGSEESPAFVNGILDEIARSLPDKQ